MEASPRISVVGFTAFALLLLTILVMAGQAWAHENQDVAIAEANEEPSTEFRQEAITLGEPGVIQFLSGPSAGDPLDIALAFIQANKGALALSTTDLADITVTDLYQTKDTGVTHIYLRQRYKGIEVASAHININIAADGSIISLNSRFVSNLIENVNADTPTLTAVAATEAAAKSLKLNITQPLVVEKSLGGADQAVVLNDGGISLNPIPARLMYQPAKSEVHLVWHLSIYQLDQQHFWTVSVDAQSGDILNVEDQVIHDEWGSFQGDAEAASAHATTCSGGSGNSDYCVYPMPVESPHHTTPLPPTDGRTMVTAPWNDAANASPFGWHDTNGAAGAEFTVTQGNNVHAYDDGDNPGFNPDGGANLVFNFDVGNVDGDNPNIYESAAITNLFYWNNIIHDVWYEHGFDEASGNFQENNYGNPGAGSDSVDAEAQDGSGSCNANMFTPADGSNPRMQMYICGVRDGDLDNGVIAHEYTHGTSNRLTGGPGNASCLNNAEQGGEGWSDWIGLMMTMEAGDLDTDSRPIGTWLLGESPTGAGVRTFPYSTNMAVNPQTYNSIQSTGGQPHAVGEVWAGIIWEVSWALINEHGFNPDFYDQWNTGGNNLAMRLIIDGLKFQPCSPGFVDARDAILLADQTLTGGANQCTLWEAFAKRGLGFSAVQGNSDSVADNTEAFDTPVGCQTLDVSPTSQSICAGDTATYAVSVGAAYVPPVTMSASGHPAGSTATFTPNPVNTVPDTTDLVIGNTAGASVGSYTITIMGTDGITTDTTIATLDVYNAAPTGAPTLLTPPDGATDVDTAPDFTWTAVANSSDYLLEVATDPGFATIVYTATVAGATHSATTNLAASTLHYWRVTAQNPCGTGATSTAFTFTTVNIICSMPGLAIPDLTTVQDTINVSNVGLITDLDISLDVSHTWVGDLDFTLEHLDTGTTAVFYDRPGVPDTTFGCSGDDISASFNDEGVDGPVEAACGAGVPAIQGDFVGGDPPSTSLLSAFDFEDLSGDWQLSVFDSAGGDTGVLNEWCLIPATTTGLGTLAGNVTADESGNPIVGADITADNGVQTFTDTTDGSGNYSMSLGAGNYDVTASAPNRLPVTISAVNIITGSTTTQDFVLAGGLLAYAPSAIEEFMEIGDVVTNTVTVTNSGALTVEWNISISNYNGPSLVQVQPKSSRSLSTTCPADAFGYACTDSTEPDNLVAYNFEDISGTGTPVTLGDDEVSSAIPIGFDFNYYGTDYANIFISSNGFLTVLAGQSNGCCTGQIIPNGSDPNGIIASWWEDLNPSAGGTIHYELLGSSSERYLVVQFTNIQHFPNGTPVTFQYKLFEGSNNIEVHYSDAPSDSGMHSVGIEDQTGTVGLQYFLNTTGLSTPLAVCYLYPGEAACGSGATAWASATPTGGTLPPFSVSTFDVVFDSRSLLDVGTYTADLTFDGTYVNTVDPMPLTMHLSCPTCGFLDGSITDAFTTLPVPADIHITNGGGFDVTINGVTSYSVAIPAGDYDLTASSSGYFSETASVTLSTGVTTTQDFALVPIFGELVNDPANYDVTVALGFSQMLPLDLTNNGTIDVFYNIRELNLGYGPLPPLSRQALLSPMTAVPGSTNEAAATADVPGSSQNAAPGSSAAAVTPNGLGDVIRNFIAPGGGTPVGLEHDGFGNLLMTDISGLTVTLMDVNGGVLASFSVSGNTDNPIGITTDGTFIYVTDAIGLEVDIYDLTGAYQSSFDVSAQTTFPEGITYNPETGNLFVVNGSGGDTVHEYTTAGVLVDTFPILGFSPDGIAYDPLLCNYWLYDSGTDTVRHYDPGFNELESFPGTGAASFGNGEGVGVIGDELFVMASGASTVVVFDLAGAQATQPCGEIPWLHQDPISGTVSATSANVVDITFDATVVTQTGQYFGNMLVTNDAHEDLIVPVTMTVVIGVFDVNLSPDDALSGNPGTTVTYTVLVENSGNVVDTYDLTISDNSWPTAPSLSTVTLSPGASTIVMVTVDIPGNAATGATDVATVTATSQSDVAAFATLTLTTTAEGGFLYLPLIMKP